MTPVFDDWLHEGLAAMAEVPSMLLDPAKRVFWPCLLASLAIAIVVHARRRNRVQHPPSVPHRELWFHRTALVDYQLLFAKAFIKAVLIAPLVVSALVVATWTLEQMTGLFGTPEPTSWSRLQVGVVYTLVLFLTWDFSRFVVHALVHRIPFLWTFHQVHHSAVALTPFTVYRAHPVETLLFAVRGAVTTGVVTGVFVYFFRDRAVQYDILGVNVFGFVLNFAGSNLRHSHVWLSYGSRLERIFLSPAQHQLHHCRTKQHYDKNFGSYLAIWDRMFSTLELAGKERTLEFGLEQSECNHDPTSLLSCLGRPFVEFARSLIPSARWKRIR